MDSKNLVIALVLSCVVFFGWQFLAVEMGWVQPAQEASQTARQQPFDNADPFAAEPAAPAMPEAQNPELVQRGATVTVDTPLYTAVLNSEGCTLLEFELKKYRDGISADSRQVQLVNQSTLANAPLGLLIDGEQTWYKGSWHIDGGDLTLSEGQTGTLRFTTQLNGLDVVRELTFNAGTYTIDETVSVAAQTPRTIKIAFTFGAASLKTDQIYSLWDRIWHFFMGGQEPKLQDSVHNPTRVSWQEGGSFDEERDLADLTAGVLVKGNARWMAIMNNYFLGAVSMPGADASAKASYGSGVYQVAIGKTNVSVLPDRPAVENCTYYIGPKEGDLLKAAPNDLKNALDYGFFSIIARPLVYLLQFLYGFVHNYGVAIILMTILVKIVFWPLSKKSYASMNQMKKLQPMIQKIKEKHNGDKTAINQEVMQLYKTYKVNPMGGCLPILIQIPVFFALYQALLNAIELRHAPFISHVPFTNIEWLADLSAIDPFLITPLVMGLTMFLQQKMTPAPADPTQAKIMLFMPIIFVVLFVTFPAGLVLYWLTNSVISMFQQWLMMRKAQ